MELPKVQVLGWVRYNAERRKLRIRPEHHVGTDELVIEVTNTSAARDAQVISVGVYYRAWFLDRQGVQLLSFDEPIRRTLTPDESHQLRFPIESLFDAALKAPDGRTRRLRRARFFVNSTHRWWSRRLDRIMGKDWRTDQSG